MQDSIERYRWWNERQAAAGVVCSSGVWAADVLRYVCSNSTLNGLLYLAQPWRLLRVKQLPSRSNKRAQLYPSGLRHCLRQNNGAPKTATQHLSSTQLHRRAMRDGYQWTRITRIQSLPCEWLCSSYITRPFSRSEPTWQRESLWMKDAVKANVLLCFIGCSESLWMCILKINPPKAFLFLAAHKDQRQLPLVLQTFGLVPKTDVTAQAENNAGVEEATRPVCVPTSTFPSTRGKLEQWQRWGSGQRCSLTDGRPSLSFDNLQSSTIIQSHPNTKLMDYNRHLFSKGLNSFQGIFFPRVTKY